MIDTIQTVVGAVIPFIIKWSDKYFPKNGKIKYACVIGVCILGAIASEFMKGTFTGINFQLLPATIGILAEAQAMYVFFIKE